MRTMMRTIGLLLIVAAVILTGCVSRYERDMALAAERTAQERYAAQQAQAQAQAQQAQAQAQQVEAQARADAQIGMAQAQAQASMVSEQERTARETAWFGVLPWILLIVVGGLVAVGYWWLFLRAKVQIEVVRVTALLPAPSAMVLPPERRIPTSVRRRAEWTGTTPAQAGGCWLLVNAGGTVVEVMEPRQR